jgi:hypothetical protein
VNTASILLPVSKALKEILQASITLRTLPIALIPPEVDLTCVHVDSSELV